MNILVACTRDVRGNGGIAAQLVRNGTQTVAPGRLYGRLSAPVAKTWWSPFLVGELNPRQYGERVGDASVEARDSNPCASSLERQCPHVAAAGAISA
jgi:hypothetical protein